MMMARKKKKVLNEKHKRVLEVIEDSIYNIGRPPSIREICKKAKISSTSVANYYLDHLEELNYIKRDSNVARGISLVRPLDKLFNIPVMGRIVASEPVPMPASDFGYFDPESTVAVAQSLLPAQTQDLFALEVQGDSMIDAMVSDGDIVVMKRAETVDNGEMVAVWLTDNDETTLKYFFRENGKVRLQPANPTMEPIYIDDPSTLQIQGKVVMVLRQMDAQ